MVGPPAAAAHLGARSGRRIWAPPFSVGPIHDVRQAETLDRAAVTRSVAAAFAHDPAWAFLLGDDYERLAPFFAGALFDLRVGSGDVWVTGDLAAVAMWECPGAVTAAGSGQIWEAFRARAGERAWARLAEYESALDAVRPATAYWYLGVLATHPEGQGQGRASAVMAPVLERADGEGTCCCLETSTDANRVFYGHRGFTVATVVPLASGPPTWWLRRDPSAPTRPPRSWP